KIILLGEHTVVYGAPALAAGIERGARAKASHDRASTLWLAGIDPSGPREHAPADEGDIGRAFAALLAALPGAPPARVEAESELPAGGGLGSWAALGVAIARALDALAPREHLPAASDAEDDRARRVLGAACAWERVFHGNPSGIDTAAAALSGCFRYTRNGG